MIPVGHLAPQCWDQNIVMRLLDGDLYPHGLPVKHHAGYPNTEGAALIIPGRYWHKQTDRINEAIRRYRWVLAFRVSDEEDLFDINQVEHPNVRWWVQTPRPGKTYDARLFGVGYPPHFNHLQQRERHLDVFLSAQDTHQRRHDCFTSLEGIRGSRVHRTPGFTQGMDPAEYRDCMAAAKIAPAPSGAVSVDSFRVWEALEAGALPVADMVSPVDGVTDYWRQLFGEVPFPTVEDWAQVSWPGLLEEWPANATTVATWYAGYKRTLSGWLVEDLTALGAL